MNRRVTIGILLTLFLTITLGAHATSSMIATPSITEGNTWIPFIPGAIPGTLSNVSMKCSDNAGLCLDSNIAGMYSTEVVVDSTIYQRLSIPNEGCTVEIGKPEVPIMRRYLEIPYDVNLAVEIIYSSFAVLEGYRVYPVQPPLKDVQTDATQEFVRDQKTYLTNEFYPSFNASIEETLIMRGHRIVSLVLCPVQHNPVTNQLRVYKKIEVRINYDHPARIKGIEKRLESDAFESLAQTFILNYKVPGSYVVRVPQNVTEKVGADYLIITDSVFVTQVQPLADWKQKKGFKAKIVTTVSPGLSTSAEIKNYIQNAYNTWDPPPTYILLVGDVMLAGGANGIPTYYGVNADVDDAGRVGTDLYYARLDGNDYLPDAFVGRISVKTANEATIVINKMLNYERNPPMTTNWFDDALVTWSTERSYWIETSDKIRNSLQSHGYTVHTVGVNPGVDGAATQQIINAINSGCFVISHRDHGDSQNGPLGGSEGWTDPGFTTANVNQLANGNMLPIMFSMECRCGWFDGETDDDTTDPSGGVDCLGEVWLKANNRGGVGFIGSTRISNTGWNDHLCRGFYDAIWPDLLPPTQNAMYELGQIMTYGKINMISNQGLGDTSRLELEEFNLLGDPEMSIWTSQPRPLTVTHPSTIGSGLSVSQKFVVKVMDGANPVLHALVCLWKQNDVYTVGYTDAGGHVTFDIKPSTGGTMDITVTKYNYLPYEGTIAVTDGGATMTVTPSIGPPGVSFTATGGSFNDGETVNIDFGGIPIGSASASGGSFSQLFTVPAVPEGSTNVIAVGQTSSRVAVTVFNILPTQPLPDPYIYCPWDASTWHLNPNGGDPVWNNPCIQLYDVNGNPVSSGNLEIGKQYRIEATIYNSATVAADGTAATFTWAKWGIGQIHWNLIGEATVDVPPSPGYAKASVLWAPIETGHCCIMVDIYHSLDSNIGNNRGQENCEVHVGTSPAVISFDVYNPTNTAGLVYLEVTVLGNESDLWLWKTRIERAYPQELNPGGNQTATFTVDVPQDARLGESRDVTVTGIINGETIGGIQFQIFKGLLGDINVDRKINILDLSIAAHACFTVRGDPRWDERADVDGNGAINIIDIGKIAKNFGKTY